MKEVFVIRNINGSYFDGVDFTTSDGAAFYATVEECEYNIATSMFPRGSYLIEKIYIKL